MFNSVMTSFKSRMSQVTWMDEATRTVALDKANSIAHKIGYPDFVVQPALLDQYYQQVLLLNYLALCVVYAMILLAWLFFIILSLMVFFRGIARGGAWVHVPPSP